MQKTKSLLIISFLFVILFLIISMKVNGEAYTPHSPIVINSNGGFTPANGVVGGNGTNENPYIISGLDIVSFGRAIEIRDTNASFIVRDCLIRYGQKPSSPFDTSSYTQYAQEGIVLSNTRNGRIENNTIYHKTYGISIFTSVHIIISNNIIKNNSGDGIRMDSGTSNIIENNTIITNDWGGICVYDDANYNVFHHNFLADNGGSNKDGGVNTWDDGQAGNYWSDYIGVDANNDSIGDIPHPISGGSNMDRYPIVPASSQVNPIDPYKLENATTVNITVSVTDISAINTHNVSLYWRNSTDNETWGVWKLYDTAAAAPFAWTLSVVNQTRYYQFYSIVSYRWILDGNDRNEDAPAIADVECFVYYPPPPNVPPTVAIISQFSGKVNGTIIITGAASDDVSVQYVQLDTDGDGWATKIVSAPWPSWSHSLDTTKLTDGKHAIKARAYDGTNYSDEKALNIDIDNLNPSTIDTTKKENPPDTSWIFWLLAILAIIGTIIGVMLEIVLPLLEHERKEPKENKLPPKEETTGANRINKRGVR